ncbi:hypothetical protein [Edaphobacter aggregans]|uniref:hypothetical protein n=1 Tax=Edaphobacter aggregans TaxID=570835 RepID=UPI0005561B62|nr:hypothetical protein [Edaphobacter aggregans]
MRQEQRRYQFAGSCILFFIAAQTFQELATRFWIPDAHGPEHELLIYLLPMDRARALLILSSILLLVIPYIAIAMRYWSATPIAALTGLIAGISFIGFEFTARSMDFFVVGQRWANSFRTSGSPVEKAMIVHRYLLWSDMARGIYFEIMLSFLLASCAFLYATLQDQDRWSRLASLAFAINILRLLGRISSTFAGQTWLDALNNSAYFPIVFVINCLLAAWFFHLANSPLSPARVRE